MKGIKELFDNYGATTKIALCPNKAIGIVVYENEAFALNAF